MKTKILIGFLLLALAAMSFLWFEKWVLLGYTTDALDRKEEEVKVLTTLIASALSPNQLIKEAEKNGMLVSKNTDDKFWTSPDAKLAVVVEGMTFYYDEDNHYIDSSMLKAEDRKTFEPE